CHSTLEQDLQRELWRAALCEQIGGHVEVDVVPRGHRCGAYGVVAGALELACAPALDALHLRLVDVNFCRRHRWSHTSPVPSTGNADRMPPRRVNSRIANEARPRASAPRSS